MAFNMTVKETLDAFLRAPSHATYVQLKNELEVFNCVCSMKTISSQLVIPLVLKLDTLSNHSQDLRTYCLECITLLMSKIYLVEKKALPTLLVIIIKQINKKLSDTNVIEKNRNISEELKLASVQCMAISLKRSASDVLEQFYVKDNAMIMGQMLLLLVDFIENEKYKALIRASLECLTIVFYIHDEADKNDVVFRNQVVDTLFIFLPKIITILHKIAIGDNKLSDNIKQMCIKILGRILHITFEDCYPIIEDEMRSGDHDTQSFNALLKSYIKQKTEIDFKKNFGNLIKCESHKEKLEQLKQLHNTGRTHDWLNEFCTKLHQIFLHSAVLRSHTSTKIRQEYAAMNCVLAIKCGYNLKRNFLTILENVIALSEDVDPSTRNACQECLKQLNAEQYIQLKQLYEYSIEQLFEEHLTNLPRIIYQCDSKAQYAEILFLKGFLKSLPFSKLRPLLTIPQNIEGFSRCILMATKLTISSDLLNKSQNDVRNTSELQEYDLLSLPWRKFQNISCNRCIDQLISICQILGNIGTVNQLFYDYLIELYNQTDQKTDIAVNKSEIILVALWLSTAPNDNVLEPNLVNRFLELLLKDENWFLLIEPDNLNLLKSNKSIKSSTDYTPGLYESAIQIRIQNVNDSDDEDDDDLYKVNWVEAQTNVLHTCIVLDALGHCALYLGIQFDTYTFRSLYKVLLKLADKNVMIHQAAYFAVICIQKALKYSNYENLIERHMDYIEHNLSIMLKKHIDTESTINVLSTATKLCSRLSISYFEHSFQTIYEQCTKSNQRQYITSYLKLFVHFLQEFTKWVQKCHSFDLLMIANNWSSSKQEAVEDANNEMIIISNWLKELLPINNGDENLNENNMLMLDNDVKNLSKLDNDGISKTALPQHISLIKSILFHLTTLLSSNDTMHTILGLESLIYGLPLLTQYENTFYPLVHSVWKPFVKKLQQNDIVVLNRCFKLLLCLASTATDFITKRCLDDVVPFIKLFLKQAAADTTFKLNKNSTCTVTQEIRLQVEMLEQLATMIVNLDIDGKNLIDITEIILLYLNREHPKKLQNAAIIYCTSLHIYNGPMMYVLLMKKAREKEYKMNCENLLNKLMHYNK